jgi:hypothetical protein
MLDVSDVELIDSTVLGQMIKLGRRLWAEGVPLLIAEPSEGLRNTFDHLGVDERFFIRRGDKPEPQDDEIARPVTLSRIVAEVAELREMIRGSRVPFPYPTTVAMGKGLAARLSDGDAGATSEFFEEHGIGLQLEPDSDAPGAEPNYYRIF